MGPSERCSSSPPHHIQVTLRPCHIQATLWPRRSAAARRPVTSRLPCGCTGRPPTPQPCHIQATLWPPRSAAAARRPSHPGYPIAAPAGHPPTLLRVAARATGLRLPQGRLPWRAGQPRATPIGLGTGQPGSYPAVAGRISKSAGPSKPQLGYPVAPAVAKDGRSPGDLLFSAVGRPTAPTPSIPGSPGR